MITDKSLKLEQCICEGCKKEIVHGECMVIWSLKSSNEVDLCSDKCALKYFQGKIDASKTI